MVELYSLKLLGNELTGIDQDVAQLEFETSTIEQSLFASMTLDANLISTDSLDMEKLHLKCETNKNDYKLTFEDSGQWTTSMAPDEDVSSAEAPSEAPSSNLTTWGRIRSTEPFDDKTISLPELRPQSDTQPQPRPASLVANFVERQPTDYEYSETYLGDGRYLDVNDNEIGFIPESTAGIQRCKRSISAASPATATTASTVPPLKPPRRTFADLGGSSLPRDDSGFEPSPSSTAPDLKFLSLPFEVPAFCQQQPGPFHVPSLDDILRTTKKSHLTDLDDKQFNEKMAEFAALDSGLGSAALSGPSHIEDWASLATLLPKHVVDACTFFKSNSHVLTGSSTLTDKKPSSLFAPRASSSMIPRSSSNQLCSKETIDSGLGGSSRSRKQTCECQTQSLFTPISSENPKSRLCLSSKLKLHAQELAIIGLPQYKTKQGLVENVVEGVAEVVRGSSPTNLTAAFEALISDGLNHAVSSWEMIKTVTSPGKATSAIIQVVNELEASEKPKNSRSQHFIQELLRLRSLDGWLSYAVLKENVLSRLYDENAFMMKANTAYRSLFWRLIESLELLSVIEQRPGRRDRGDSGMGAESPTWGSASRIASDSRVPKSSSIPSKLVNEALSPVPGTSGESKTEVADKPSIERPATLSVDVDSRPEPSSTPSPRAVAPSPSPSQLSSTTSSTSMRRSRIPLPSQGSTTTSSTRSRTSLVGATTTAIINTVSSPTRLPLFRRQYGSRAISQQRPYTTATPITLNSAYRRPTTTPATTGLARTRKYFA